VSKYDYTKPVLSFHFLARAYNSFSFIFKEAKKIKSIKEAINFIGIGRRRPLNEGMLLRKINVLSLSGVGDLFFEFLGHIRDKQNTPPSV